MEQTFITVEAANEMLRSMVQQQVGAFTAQQQTIESLNTETRSMIVQASASIEKQIGQVRDDVNQSLIANKAAAEAHVIEQIGALRTQTERSVTHVDGPLEEMRALLLLYDMTQSRWSPSRRARNS